MVGSHNQSSISDKIEVLKDLKHHLNVVIVNYQIMMIIQSAKCPCHRARVLEILTSTRTKLFMVNYARSQYALNAIPYLGKHSVQVLARSADIN